MKGAKKRESGMNALEIEVAIAALHSTGDYLVLRRLNLARDSRLARKAPERCHVALCLDTETTGLDYRRDKVIELGIVAFEFDPETGEIFRISERYSGFEDPGFPIPAEVVEITGISDEMVRGQAFDDAFVNLLAQKSHLVIAHNAAFDRKFVEARFPAFAKLPWACTVSQIDWGTERVSSRTLEYLLFKTASLTINAHRALDDAEGVLGLLLERLPVTGAPIFRTLLKRAHEVTSRLYAVSAPFDKKDLLKDRGYRWSDGSQGGSKAWWRDVPAEAEPEELAYLASEIYPRGNTSAVQIMRCDAYARFSVRE
ncbi:Exonuclease RNase T and DNA polymerase III [Citrifermentans bremense]|uniref:Exonuclease RNase T and DNA polymerase III n=1 Tax=Citrifermentans bremense TaxID=60035 RepID=A0A6S6M6U2_9BACT|nr:3'-5' exonuclease [Citrifermentans bremense]BCG47095.1 Exonuclease RNase T and DNA polymerase III [Citrifermentans bremense]